jgi:hypothetical protein
VNILVIALCAMICGANEWTEIAEWGRTHASWLKRFLALPNGIPSHDTFGRVFGLLNPQAYEGCLLSSLSGKQVCRWQRDQAFLRPLSRATSDSDRERLVGGIWACAGTSESTQERTGECGGAGHLALA